MALSTERGTFVVDATTHLPAYALRTIKDDRAIGCCNIAAASNGFYTTGWNLVAELSFAP